MKLPLARVADVLGMGREGAGGDFDRQAVALGYSIDSRTIRPGELLLAFDGEKKFAGADGPRIDGVAKGHGLAVEISARTFSTHSKNVCNSGERQLHAVFSALPLVQSYPRVFKDSAATCASSKGTAPLLVVCTCSWPFPAISTMSPGRDSLIAR